MKQLLFLLLCFVSSSPCVQAQEEQPADFTSDRPGATAGVDILPKGRFQWETGMGWSRTKYDGLTYTLWTLNTSLLRWGFSDYAELQIGADRLLESVEGERTGGFANVLIGTKVKLFDGWKALPLISLGANLWVPGGKDSEFMPHEWGGEISLLFDHPLNSWLTLGYESALAWYEDTRRPTFFYGGCLSFKPTSRLTLIIDEYNNSTSEGTDSWIELSAGFQVSKRMQVDIGTDIWLNYPKDFQNLTIGLSWQLTKR